MNLVKTSLLNAIAVTIRLFSMLVLNKILAVYVGPAGYAVVGQLQSIIASITALASAGVSTGVTKYTAENKDDHSKQVSVWKSAFSLAFGFSLVLSVICFAMSEYLSVLIFSKNDFSYVFVAVSVGLFFYALNTLLLSVLNGLKEIKAYVFVNICNSLIALLIIGSFTFLWGMEGALVALALNQSLVFIITFYILKDRKWLAWRNFYDFSDFYYIRPLLKFSLMALATSVIGPISLVVVRNFLISGVGLDAAGYWEAMNRVSGVYLLFISTPLTVYFVPRFAEIFSRDEIVSEIRNGLRLFVPVGVFIAVVIYIFRDHIIEILFTRDFGSVSQLFKWQLSGDVVRIAAWIFSYFLLAKAQVGYFIAAEVGANIILVFCSYFAIEAYGLEGAAIGYLFSNVFYFLLLWIFYRKYLNSRLVF